MFDKGKTVTAFFHKTEMHMGGRQSAGASASREEQATGSTCMVQIYAAPVIAQDPSAFCLTGHIEEENSAIG